MIIDSDSHIFEPDDLYAAFCEPEQRALIPDTLDYGLIEATTPLGERVRKRGLVRPTECPADPKGGYDPIVRVREMEKEGIDRMVCFPSVVSSLCVYPLEVEAAMVTAYNNWISHFCSFAQGRLFTPIVITMRDMDLAVTEIERVSEQSCFIGIVVHTRSIDRNLDDPFFGPLWRIAETLDLPILVHGGTARPPYPVGTEHQGDNFFLMHLMHHPTEQMLAFATLLGGGVADKFSNLRFGFFESGCGWVPWFVERVAEHWRLLPEFVPKMCTSPWEHIADGRCFFSCEPDEVSLRHFIDRLGTDALLYASDYPHWDSVFPSSVSFIRENPDLTDAHKQAILTANALKLYARLEQ